MNFKHNRRSMLLGASAFGAAGCLPLEAWAQAAPASLPPAPTPADWAKTPAVSYVRVAPSGNKICFLRESNGSKYLCVNVVGDTNTQVFNLGSTEVTGLDFVSDDHVVIMNVVWGSAQQKVRHTAASIYNLKEKSLHTLFQDLDGFTGAILTDTFRVQMDGQTYIIAGARKQGDTDFLYLYKFDLNGHGTIYDQGPLDIDGLVLGGDGRHVARAAYYDHNQHYQLEMYDGSQWKTVFQGKYELDYPNLMAIDADGTSVIVKKRDADQEWRYYRLSRDGTFSAPLPHTADQASIAVDTRTLHMHGYVLRGDWGTYEFTDPLFADLADKAQKAVPGYRMSIHDYADDPHKMIVYSEGDDDAGSYYYIDFATGNTVTIGSLYPSVPAEWISSKKPISYKASDGLTIPAYLTLPPNRPAKNLPLIVMAHGSPTGRTDIGMDSDVQTYADLGFAVIQPNCRGALGYGAAFTTAGYGQFGQKIRTDLSDAITALADQGLIDPHRVAIIGGAMGGLLALQAMAFQPGVYRCAVVFDQAGDLAAISSGSVDVSIWERDIVRWVGSIDQLQKLAVAPAAKKVEGAILMFQNDGEYDYSRSGEVVSALKAAGKDVTYYKRDWSDTEAERIATANTVCDFLKQRLLTA